MFINASYFIGNINIPNKNDQFNENKELNTLINDGVHSILKSVLGIKNYLELVSYVNDGELEVTAPQKWKDLVNGCEYIHGNKRYYWKGLIYKLGTTPKSILADYVYCLYIEQNNSILAGIGEVVVNGKNATNINSTQRYVNAWNNFISELVGDIRYINNFYYHCGVPILDYYHSSNESKEDSLFSFLERNKDNYADCTFNLPNNRRIEIKNTLGL